MKRFQEKTRKVLEKHIDWYTKRQPDELRGIPI